MRPTSAQLRQLKRDNLEWPVALAAVPPADWPHFGEERGPVRIAVWRSRTFLVQAFAEAADMVRLSVNRTEWDERQNRYREDITWDELQRLKAEAGYEGHVAVEVFPPGHLVVNVANMRHLWVMPAGAERLPFVWKVRAENRRPVPAEAVAA